MSQTPLSVLNAIILNRGLCMSRVLGVTEPSVGFLLCAARLPVRA